MSTYSRDNDSRQLCVEQIPRHSCDDDVVYCEPKARTYINNKNTKVCIDM